MFVFEDPKDVDAFYNYINTKYQLNYMLVDTDVPFKIMQRQYYFSFYEVEIPTKTINLAQIFIDAALENNAMDPIFVDSYSSRIGSYYIAIEVYNDEENDCLHENSLSRTYVLEYLRALKNEYLTTHNYNEVSFK